MIQMMLFGILIHFNLNKKKEILKKMKINH